MIRIALTLAFLAVAQPSLAADPVEKVRALLDAGDIDGLEQALRALHERQREGDSAATLREINARLFETTHPERGAVILRWQASHPDSIYAATAAAWRAIKLLEAAGSLEARYDPPISPAGLGVYDGAKREARSAAEHALAVGGAYAPAHDAWLRLRVVLPNRDRLARVAEELMSAAPEAESVRIIIAAALEWSPNPGGDVLNICLTYTRRTADYDVDSCVIEAAIPNNGGGDLVARAADALRKTDDPAFDRARLTRAIWAEGPANWDLDQIETWYRRIPLSMADLHWYVNTGRRIAGVGKRPDILAEGFSRALEEIAIRNPDNPLDPSLRWLEASLHLERYLGDGDPEDLALARRAWEAGMVHGSTTADYWQTASLLATADKETWDVRDAVLFHENAIAYSGHSLPSIVFAFFWLDEARLAAEKAEGAPEAIDVQEQLQCPMLRMARLADALCRNDPSVAMFCDPTSPPFAHGPEILATGSQSCPEVANTRLSALKYEPVPYSEVSLPWE